MFHTDWCPHCLALLPRFTDVGMENLDKILTATFNCESNPAATSFCLQMQIKYFPVIGLYNGNRWLQYYGDQTYANLLDFAENSAEARWGESKPVLEIHPETERWRIADFSDDEL